MHRSVQAFLCMCAGIATISLFVLAYSATASGLRHAVLVVVSLVVALAAVCVLAVLAAGDSRQRR